MASPNVLNLTNANFDAEVLNSSLPVMVHFMATWAGPCRQMAPTIDRIADEHVGKAKVGKLDIDESPETAGKYGAISPPIVLFFKGGVKVASQAGLSSYDTLVRLLGV